MKNFRHGSASRLPSILTFMGFGLIAAAMLAGGSGEHSSSLAANQAAAVDISVGADNRTRTVFSDPDHQTVFRSYDNSGDSTSIGPEGPYSGWTVRALSDGEDGLTRALWNSVDGSAALWMLGPRVNEASYFYGPEAGWTIVDISVGSYGTTHLLSTNIDGRTRLTRIALSGAVLAEATYGPFAGWTARSISSGTDGLTRLLWTNTDGRAGMSLLQADQIIATFRFAPGPGWTAQDIAVASDNRARILFSDTIGQMSLWTVDNSGVVTNSTNVYSQNQSAMTATRVAAGADGVTRVLWTGPVGGVLWLMNSDNSVRDSKSFLFCGDFGKTLGCGYWDY
jgi:hypothetical protein